MASKSIKGTVIAYYPGNDFPSISVTGTRCDQMCEHCRAVHLRGMIAAEDVESFSNLAQSLAKKGCKGYLLRNIGSRHEVLRQCNAVVLKEYYLQHFSGTRMLFNQLAERADHTDNLLRAIIPGAGLRTEDEYPGFHGEMFIIHDPVIQDQNMKGIEHLALVFVQALGLDIKDKGRINHCVLSVFQQICKAFLVMLFDLCKFRPECSVIRERTQITQLLRILDPRSTN